MTRAQFRDTVMVRGPTGMVGIAPITATASLCDVGTLTLIAESIYANESGTQLLPNPVPVSVDGSLDFWLAAERELDLVVTCPGYIDVRVTVTADAAYVPGSDPFPEYLTRSAADALYDGIGAATAGDSAHVAASDPHLVYLTQTEGDALVASHAAAADPHPTYLTQTEADARYMLQGTTMVDSALRTYVQHIMAVIDPGGSPPPPP